ncbi:MAG: hypothetical protein JXR76_21040 [Deltaproteobacteria bacterium]|nr:hypothetical protein [Deltaproteobacteria bacterium]
MAFNSLSTPAMVAVSGRLVNADQDMPLLQSYPMTAGVVPLLVVAHNGLLGLKSTDHAEKKQAEALAKEILALDKAHDERYRVLYTMLGALAQVAGAERRKWLEHIRDTLMPEGLLGTKRTYMSEYGGTIAAAARITAEMADTLKEIVVEGQSLLDLFHSWIALGKRLGDLEHERYRIMDEAKQQRHQRGEVQKRRFRWVRTMNLLVDLMELDDNLPEQLRSHILNPLVSARQKHTRKKPTRRVANGETAQ